MITLGVVGGKLALIRPSGYEIKPWGLEITDGRITISGLSGVKPSTYSGVLSDFIKVDTGLPFDSIEALTEYVAPYLGFKAASGGSEVPTVYKDTILVSSAEILTMGSSPVDLAAQFSVIKTTGQFYNIHEIISIFRPESEAYSGTERFMITGCFTVISDPFTLNKHVPAAPSIMIARTSSENIFNDGGYVNFRNSFLANRGLELTTWSGDDVTLGDGTLEFRITYTIEDL